MKQLYGKSAVLILYPFGSKILGPLAASSHVSALSFAVPIVNGPKTTLPTESTIRNVYELFNTPKSSASADNPIYNFSVVKSLISTLSAEGVPRLVKDAKFPNP